MRTSKSCLAVLALVTIASSPLPAQVGAPPGPANPLSAMTGQQLIAVIDEVMLKLTNAAAVIGGNANIVINSAIQTLSQARADFIQQAGDDIVKPLNELSMEPRLTAIRLQDMTGSLNVLVSRQRECIAQNLDLFLSGVRNATSDLRMVVPLRRPDDPRLIKFRFQRQLAANVVPKEGGPVTISGYRLWGSRGVAPLVSLLDENRRNTLLELKPAAGGSDAEFVITLPPTVIEANSGQCLVLSVQTRAHDRFLGIFPNGLKQTADLSLPVCIPASYGIAVGLEGTLNYTVGDTKRRTLTAKRFHFTNTDMANKIDVSDTKNWDGQIPNGFRIVEVTTNVVEKENDSSIGVTFNDRSVTAAGWLSDAEDFRPGGIFGPRIKIDDTVWTADITPIAAGTVHAPYESAAALAPELMGDAGRRMCVNFKVTGQPDVASIYKFRITQRQGPLGAALPPLYESERITATVAAQPGEPTMGAMDQRTVNIGGFQIQHSYNPSVVNGSTELCATVTSNGSCSF